MARGTGGRDGQIISKGAISSGLEEEENYVKKNYETCYLNPCLRSRNLHRPSYRDSDSHWCLSTGRLARNPAAGCDTRARSSSSLHYATVPKMLECGRARNLT